MLLLVIVNIYMIKILNNTKNDKTETKPELSENHAEMIRIFARYLLANHWEVLQLTQAEKYRYNEKNIILMLIIL